MTVFDFKIMCANPKETPIMLFQFNNKMNAYKQIFSGKVFDIPSTLDETVIDSWDLYDEIINLSIT